ncbi:SDR family oxidoreductase [uncultured Enterococcus sp.]|uniref:SDR family oxidoreductase n=1 Tax=uncultured Enterococcus sp. TaxID=167972 RepID=UPI002AA68341|nr:SDR family oxidoreductase [uncultured Enterococcus sp.]
MKIFVAGATGRVGRELVANLQKQGHFVYAGARKTDQIIENEHIAAVFMDLHASVDTLADGLADAEIVIFVAGSRGKDLLQTDLNGAVKLIQAAEKKGIRRYVQLSSAYSLEPERWQDSSMSSLLDYTIAKHYADAWLINNSNLDYTILQPGALKEIEGSGRITIGSGEAGENSILNVAETLAQIVTEPKTIKKVIPMHDGNTPIKEALQTFN